MELKANVSLCAEKPPNADWYGLMMNGVIPTFLVIFGIGGMSKSSVRLSANPSKLVHYLLFLYKWDALLLISAFGLYGLPSILNTPIGIQPLHGELVYFYRIFYPLVNLSMTGSMWTIVVICIERFIALYQPLRHHSRDNNRLSIIVRTSVSFGSILVTLPKIFELSVSECWDGKGSKPRISLSDLHENPTYQFFYEIVCNSIFVCPLPFIVICTVTIKTWLIRRSVLKRSKERDSSSLRSPKNNRRRVLSTDKTTFYLLAMISKLLVCQSAPTLLSIIEMVISDTQRRTIWFRHLINASNTLIMLNSATNWLLFTNWPRSRINRVEMSNCSALYRSPSFLSSLSSSQLTSLQHVWHKNNHEQLGIDLLRASMTANPLLRNKLAHVYSLDVFDESAHATKVSHHGQNIGGMLDRLFSLALNGQGFERAFPWIILAARAHARHGIVLRNADWIVVKRYLLEQLLQKLNDDNKRLGGKLVTMVVSELKHGFTYGVPSISDRRGALTDSTPLLSVPARTKRSLCVVSESSREFVISRTSSFCEERLPVLKFEQSSSDEDERMSVL